VFAIAVAFRRWARAQAFEPVVGLRRAIPGAPASNRDPRHLRGTKQRPLDFARGQVVGRKADLTVLYRVQQKHGGKLSRPASTSADLSFHLPTMEVLYQLS
jgi:hypothetical protein